MSGYWSTQSPRRLNSGFPFSPHLSTSDVVRTFDHAITLTSISIALSLPHFVPRLPPLIASLFVGVSVFAIDPVAQAKDVSEADVNGTWKNKGGNEFRIWALGRQRLQVEFSGVYEYDSPAGPTANTGEGSGSATINGDIATFKPDEADDDCAIMLRFSQNKLEVTQTGTCGFGLNVTAAGTYRRTSTRKPVFESTASEPAPEVRGMSSFADFSEFRDAMDAKAKTDAWKTVMQRLPGYKDSHRMYVKAWVESNVVQRLMHVDSYGDDNESITLYYWKDGQLTSVFQLRTGPATQISDVDHATEIYNFANEKLVGWKRTPIEGGGDGSVPHDDPGFADTGKSVLADSIRLTAPVYKQIGAD